MLLKDINICTGLMYIIETSNGKESTQPIIHDSDVFDPISFFKGLPGKLGAEIWSALIQYIDDFVRVTWLIFISFKLCIFVNYCVTKFKEHRNK